MLSSADAARVGARGTGARVILQTAGGKVATNVASLDDVEMLGRSEHDVDCLLDEPGQRGKISLMGQSMLARFAIIRIEGDQLTLI